MLIVVALLAAACAEGSSDPARELEEARKLLAEEKYDEAYEQFLTYAEERNNHLAEFTVGMFHRLGWGRPVDHKAAFTWFERAAEGGVPVALHYTGEYLLEGKVTAADPARAAELFRESARLGHLLSNVSLAEMYFTGNGVPKDVETGLALCRSAAQKGVVAAQYKLGRVYLEGEPVERDYAAARSWLEQAATAGHAEACFDLGRMAEEGLGQEPDPGAARHWFALAAERAYAPAYLPAATLYFGDGGAERSPEELARAYFWATAAARRPADDAAKARAEDLRNRVRPLLPAAWPADLDREVDEHLAGRSPE